MAIKEITIEQASGTSLGGDHGTSDKGSLLDKINEIIQKTNEHEASSVYSVFSRSGTVVAEEGDYDASQIDNDSGVSGDTVKDALDFLNPMETGMVKFVSTGGSDTLGDGSIQKPYKTIQKAYDEVALLEPTMSNPGAVLVFPGLYPETVIADEDCVAIVGLGGQNVVNIGTITAPSIIVTNATRASVATFLAAGGGSDPETHFGLLSAGANVPRNVQFRNISLYPDGGAAYRLMAIGIGAGNSVAGSELNLMGCCNWGKTWLRGVNYVSFQDGTWMAAIIETHNVSGVWINDSQITGYSGYYNVADDEPSDDGNYGLCGGKTLNNGGISLTGSARAGAGDPNGGLTMFQTTGNVDLDDTSELALALSGIGGNIDAEATASFDLKGCHVQGNIVLAAGVGTAQMDGGRYMGSLTDPGAKLVRNVGA